MSRRRILKRLAVVVVVPIALLVLVGAYASYQWNRLVVTIRHDAAASVHATDVELSARGDRVIVRQLPPGEQLDLVLEPEGESALELRYKLGDVQCSWSGAYVEPSSGYRVMLEIRGCGEVREQTSIWP